MQPSPDGPAAEEDLAAEQLTRDLANELMSPYCPGRTISSCPSQNARKLEDFILEQAEAGKSRDEIEQILVEEFGRDKLGTVTSPHVVWTASAIALLAALLIGVWAYRRVVQRQALAHAGGGASPADARPGGAAMADTFAAPSRDAAAPSDDELDRLEDALDDIREF